MELYHEAQRALRDPEAYQIQGRSASLSVEDREFMIELVRQEPFLFRNEIREHLGNSGITSLAITTLHESLVHKVQIALKKPEPIDSRKSLRLKYQFIEKIANMPAEFLVFTGK
jgi:hypothetical protein